ncbi:type IV pilus modification protein PilV [Stutzerimonas stutzeri]|uniref:Type IV pilus modification protein PilV n=1 Tax=Stutzerimonas stutzeri TaxID=316 RepID=A0A2N8S5I7_STUST|nr:type IV pilus modification protein PilV [Stutzerimonas stutzeri]
MSLIEVLVTLVVLAVGLLGVMALQARLQQSEMETYQRSQALLLLDDIAARITANRTAAASYVTGTASPLGAGMTCPTNSSTQQQRDSAMWCAALQGASESTSSGLAGAMIGGRGCIEPLGSNQYLLTVAWQGSLPLAAPNASVACGKDAFDGATGSQCSNDRCRRVVTTLVRVAPL